MAWPTTSNPRTEFATVRFTKDEAADMDALAAEHGMNRSQYLRFCFERQRAAALRAKKRNKKEK